MTSPDGVWRVASTMATPASIHAAIDALAKVACGGIDNGPGEVFDRDADFTVILLDAALAVGKHVAWSSARLSTPCTQLAANFELATEAINGEFVKG